MLSIAGVKKEDTTATICVISQVEVLSKRIDCTASRVMRYRELSQEGIKTEELAPARRAIEGFKYLGCCRTWLRTSESSATPSRITLGETSSRFCGLLPKGPVS